MEKNKIQKVYCALLFTRNIFGYSPKLKRLTEYVEELRPNLTAVETTANLAEEYKREHPNVEDSRILELMHQDLSAQLERLDLQISCIKENIKQLEVNISGILEQVFVDGFDCLGITKDTFEEDFNIEYKYIFDNITVLGRKVTPEMFFEVVDDQYQAAQDQLPQDSSVSSDSGNEEVGYLDDDVEDEFEFEDKVDCEEPDTTDTVDHTSGQSLSDFESQF